MICMLSKVTHFFVVHFLGAPWALNRNEPAFSLQMLLPLTLKKKLRTAILLVRAWDLLKLARGNVLLFEECVNDNEVDEYKLTDKG
jgi:hypothetical protein